MCPNRVDLKLDGFKKKSNPNIGQLALLIPTYHLFPVVGGFTQLHAGHEFQVSHRVSRLGLNSGLDHDGLRAEISHKTVGPVNHQPFFETTHHNSWILMVILSTQNPFRTTWHIYIWSSITVAIASWCILYSFNWTADLGVQRSEIWQNEDPSFSLDVDKMPMKDPPKQRSLRGNIYRFSMVSHGFPWFPWFQPRNK